MASVGALLLPRLATGIRPPSQSNMPIKGNALKTSFQHLELQQHLLRLFWSINPDMIWFILDAETQYFDIKKFWSKMDLTGYREFQYWI